MTSEDKLLIKLHKCFTSLTNNTKVYSEFIWKFVQEIVQEILLDKKSIYKRGGGCCEVVWETL